MRHPQNASPRRWGFAAFCAGPLLPPPLPHAAAPSDSLSGDQSSASQTALTIAGVAAMSSGVPAAAAPTPIAAPVQPAGSKRPMTAEERQHFMMLLILHETSRNPIGVL